jgi:uncharacterized protein
MLTRAARPLNRIFRNLPYLLSPWAALLPGAIACEPQEPPEVPKVSVAKATNRTAVIVVDGPGRPLIVDWKPEQRADLEVAMHDGVAVVHYNGSTLELLPDCRIDGEYGFVGVTTKSEVVRLENEQEIRANLPLAGPALVAQLGGELQRGTSLDVAMVIVGKTRTTWVSPTREDLRGQCERATHFVRGATVGAFVMDSGSKQQARTVADLFGVGLAGGSSSASSLRTQDGSLEACGAAEPRSATPPGQCSALIRLELNPVAALSSVTAGESPAAKVELEEEACPQGMVMTEGKCSSKEEAQVYTCDPSNAEECKTMCERGDPNSCDILGVLFYQAGPTEDNLQLFAQLTELACRGGSPSGCYNRGLAAANGWGVPVNKAESLNLFMTACQAGQAAACSSAGLQFFQGDGAPRDTASAAALYRAACDAGDYMGCTNLGVLQMSGDGVQKDEVQALANFKRACDGNDAVSCGNVGVHYEFGMVVPQGPKKAIELFERSCRLDPSSCSRLAIAYQSGFGVARNDDTARELFARVCESSLPYYPPALACSVLNIVYGENRPVNQELLSHIVPVMQPQCEQNVARACGFLGAAYFGLGDANAAQSNLARACQLGDYWACDILQRRR